VRLPISDDTRAAVHTALSQEYFEGAVEAVLEEHPGATRDDAVDTVEWYEEVAGSKHD